MRGDNPKRTGGRFARLTFPLSPLGFPLALPFPDSLTPLGRKSCILTHALCKILRTEAFFLLKGSCQVCGSAQIKRVLFNKQLTSNEWLTPQRGEDKERGSARGRTLGRGETRAQARTSLSLWFFPSHSRPTPSGIQHSNKG